LFLFVSLFLYDFVTFVLSLFLSLFLSFFVIHNLAYLPNRCQRPDLRATPMQSINIVLRPVNTKDFGFLGVGRGSELRLNLWPSVQPRNCHLGETTKK
jgi:hypothetical protein